MCSTFTCSLTVPHGLIRILGSANRLYSVVRRSEVYTQHVVRNQYITSVNSLRILGPACPVRSGGSELYTYPSESHRPRRINVLGESSSSESHRPPTQRPPTQRPPSHRPRRVNVLRESSSSESHRPPRVIVLRESSSSESHRPRRINVL